MTDKELTLKQKIENDAYERAATLCETRSGGLKMPRLIRALKHKEKP